MDKTSIIGWGSFLLGLYFLWRLLQGLVGYDSKTQEFTWMTAFGHWGALVILFVILPMLLP